jgi:hypothetical protein
MDPMGKKMTKGGMLARRAIRADIDADPNIDHKVLRSKHRAPDNFIESAMTKSVAEWDTLIAATPDDPPQEPRGATRHPEPPAPRRDGSPVAMSGGDAKEAASPAMPGLEQGVVKFTRKPAKMGEDYIFWVPRVYIKNGIVDPHVEYEVYLKKRA